MNWQGTRNSKFCRTATHGDAQI